MGHTVFVGSHNQLHQKLKKAKQRNMTIKPRDTYRWQTRRSVYSRRKTLSQAPGLHLTHTHQIKSPQSPISTSEYSSPTRMYLNSLIPSQNKLLKKRKKESFFYKMNKASTLVIPSSWCFKTRQDYWNPLTLQNCTLPISSQCRNPNNTSC